VVFENVISKARSKKQEARSKKQEARSKNKEQKDFRGPRNDLSLHKASSIELHSFIPLQSSAFNSDALFLFLLSETFAVPDVFKYTPFFAFCNSFCDVFYDLM